MLFAVAGAFTGWSNQELMLLQTAVVGTAAVGATWIIVAGGSTSRSASRSGRWSRPGAARRRWIAAACAAPASGVLVGFVDRARWSGELVRVAPNRAAGAATLPWRAGLGPGDSTALASRRRRHGSAPAAASRSRRSRRSS
jgi:hypothetical protein